MRWIRLRRTKIKVVGEKARMRMKGMTAPEEHTHFLHGLLTNDVKSLRPGTFNYNLWLRQNGQPIGDMFVFRFEDHFLIDTELPSERVIEEFNRLKLSLRVSFEDLSPSLDHVFVFGEGSGDFIKERFGLSLGDREFKETGPLIVARNDVRLKMEGYDLIGDLSGVELPPSTEITEREFEDLRIENCVPRTGKELKEGFSPLEAGLLNHAISMTKGCYVGQEAVARVYYRGRTPRTLVRIIAEGEIGEGEDLTREGKKVGVITSVSSDRKRGLGYILRDHAGEGVRTEKGVEVKVISCES
ncbi:MAG: folate-binding protein [Aquificota bacterium]|nr:folate-binding protein [Aquificota bacterium]